MLFKRAATLTAIAGVAVSLSACGINNIPTKEENARPSGRTFKSTSSVAPT